MKNIISGDADSFYNYISEGCRICQMGAKMVLFVTGVCGRNCYYCPLSEERKEDTVYANETIVYSDMDVINEVLQMNALGTGITGGEPFYKPERTIYYISLLKSEFGESHHIHLYTSIALDKDTLTILKNVGLDEIRFHPPQEIWDTLDSSQFPDSFKTAINIGLDAGIEIPAIENAEYIAEFIQNTDGFLNLNELEFTDTNSNELKKQSYSLRNDTSNAASNSRELAENLAENYQNASIHFCSSSYKDAVQFKRRLIRTAEKTARPFDEITEDGTVVYGLIETTKLENTINMLKEFEVPEDMYEINNTNIEIAWWILEDTADELKNTGCNTTIIERYPLKNGFIVETIPI
ncbi:Radical SAM domain protein [Methanohalobium evestigatum Z-7303]|uniref:Radical SAM domain protein n=1 Tax=Methanohalobium evestigatum (strain ATCC BAA-1072 / DSM 3721 / NBRC 107634 / OCM 161 / Z-7303) TaxID=644295 RepID=D7E8Q0_METEZ|nr:4Fe-4S cluster-binding domain-containing protein [Methanohalobium evestigatum]ADI73721.1 Radical SAM domain protein [Methanohalobium evestigatum Z-7303]